MHDSQQLSKQDWLEAIGVPALILQNQTISLANRSAAKLFACAVEDLIGSSLSDALMHDINTLPPKLPRHTSFYHWQIPTPDRLIPAEWTINPASFLGDDFYLVTIVPLDYLPQADDNGVEIGIYRSQPDGTIVAADDALARMLGFNDQHDIIGHNVLEYYVDAAARDDQFEQIEEVVGAFTTEIQLRRNDGQRIWVRDTMRLHYTDESSEIEYIEGTLENISSQKQREIEMRQRESRFRQLAENSPDTIFIIEAETNDVVYLNRNVFLGHPASDFDSWQAVVDIIHPMDQERVRRHWQTIDRIQRPSAIIEYRIQTSSGDYDWMQSRERVIEFDNEGNPRQILATLTNITGRKEYENMLAEYNRELEITNSMMHALAQTRQVEEAMSVFLKHLQQLIHYESASISLKQDGRLKFVLTDGVPDEIDLEAVSDLLMKKSRVSRIMKTGQWEIVNDVYEDPEWMRLEPNDFIRAWLGVPLIHHGESIGLLMLDHREPAHFTAEHAERVSALAQQVSISIANARLYEQAMTENLHRKEALDSLYASLARIDAMYQVVRLLFTAESLHAVLHDVLAIIGQAFNVSQLLLVAFDPDSGTLTHRAQSGISSDHDIWQDFAIITGQEKRTPMQMPTRNLEWQTARRIELPDGRLAYAAPVNRRGILAAIVSKSTSFDAEDRFALATLANQISIAIRNNLLDQQLRRYTSHLEQEVAVRTGELLLEQQRLQAIFDATGEGIVYLEDFVFQYVNPAFCRMVGYEPDELVGQSLSSVYPAIGELIGDENEKQSLFVQRLTGKRVLRMDTRLHRNDGETVSARLTFTLVGTTDENPLRIVAIARDISEEIALQRERARFIGNAAHELRTPLTSISLRTHMLRKQPERLEDHVDQLEHVTAHLNRMVEELLDLTRFENKSVTLEQDHIPIQDVIKAALDRQRQFIERQHVQLAVSMPPDSIFVYADGERLVQGVEKLVINALNYSPENSTIEISVETTGSEENSTVSVIISDEGEGIEQELLPAQIFQPFSRPRLGNQFETGMGLAIAREIASIHGGSVEAANRKIGGSILTLTLPVVNRTTVH